MNDIDLTAATASGGDWDTNGYGWLPIGESDSSSFTGVFDGNGHKLIGLQIRDSSIEYVGLFGYVKGATIKNLILESPQVSSTKTYTGALCGYADSATIESVKLTDLKMSAKRNYDDEYIYFGGLCGYINKTDISKVGIKNIDVDFGYNDDYYYYFWYYIGGIAGYNHSNSRISKSYITGNIDVAYYDWDSNSGSRYRYIYIGGILGYDRDYSANDESTISNCYSATDISAKSSVYRTYIYVGGVLGYRYESAKRVEIKNCINSGIITVSAYSSSCMYTGAIYGYSSYATLTGNYYLRGAASSGQYHVSDSAATAIALSETQMKLQSVFGNLDFNNIWLMDVNSGVNHPQLRDNYEANIPAELIIASQPDKTTYYHYDDIDLTGLEIQVRYEVEGETYPLKVTKDMLSDYSAETLGIHEITVSYLDQTTSFKIFVVERPVESVTVSDKTLPLDVGNTKTLSATVLPDKASDKTLTWTSSDENVAKVDENGVVTAVAKGEAEIKCESKNGISDTCNVTVLLPAKTITLQSECTINKGEKKTLELTVDPSDTTDTFTWVSNDKKVVTVDKNGEIIGVERGSTFVTVTSSRGLMATCVVTVLTLATKITLSDDSKDINIGKTATISFTYLPSNTTDTFKWSSADETIATVSQKGVITAVSKGTTQIICTASSGLSASCTVNVLVPATSVTLSNNEIRIVDSETATLTAEVFPENANNKNVTWGSEDENIATVNEYGVVSVAGTGKTKVYAQIHTGAKAYCVVNAIINPTNISFDETEITVLQQESKTLTINFTPSNSLKTVTWKSSAPEIAAVDENGKVTGVSEGTATITATSANGSVTATCTVNVPHKHKMQTVKGYEATHYEEGLMTYYKCEDCGKLYSDISGTTEIDIEDTVLPVIEHAYPKRYSYDTSNHWFECSCGDKKSVSEHDFGSWEETDAPTCTSKGEEARTCATCGYTEYRSVAALGHNYSKFWTVDISATCTKAGSESRHCLRCDSTTDPMSIPATGHDEVKDAAVAPTCTKAGKTEGKHCSVCGSIILSQFTVPATGHTDKDNDGICDTCGNETEPSIEVGEMKTVEVEGGKVTYIRFTPEVTGVYEFTSYSDYDTYGYICSSDKRVIASNDDSGLYENFTVTCTLYADTMYYLGVKHYDGGLRSIDVDIICIEEICEHDNIETVAGYAATCTESGLTDGTYCVDCGEIITKQKTISALGHKYSSAWTVDKEPTCTAKGSKFHYCVRCNAKGSVTSISATGHEYTSKITKKATCSSNGVRTYTCSNCGYSYTRSIDKTSHSYKTVTTKATMSKNGSKVTECSVCGNVKSTTTIKRISTVSISATSFVYSGNVISPTVTVKNTSGNKLVKDTDYTVKYSSGCKNVGQYTVTVTFKGNYSGTKTVTFKIVPKATSISKLTAGANKFTASWKKQTTQVDGYQLQYSTSSSMSSSKSKTVSKNSTTSLIISGLQNAKTYYVRVRTYKSVKINGENTKLYSSWSSVKSVKTLNTGVKLNKTSLTLMTGKTATLKATTTPSNAKVSWKSSDTSVAKVNSSGKITAVSKGKATITASFKYNGKTYKATCAVTVKIPSIKLNKTEATVYTGSSIALTATTTPDTVEVKWKSSNTSVAKVSSSGRVSGVKAGTAKITATFTYGGKTYSKTVM